MYCTGCGAKNSPDSHFCRDCGHKIETAPHKISEEEYDRALPEDERISALLERAYRFRKSGELTAAIALCQEAISIKPDSAAAHSIQGQLYESIGEKEKAILEYETILRLNPESVADRLKLDQLKGLGRQIVQRPEPVKTVFVDHGLPARSFVPAPIVIAGAVCGLVLFSAAAGYMLHSRTAEPAPSSDSGKQVVIHEPVKTENSNTLQQPAQTAANPGKTSSPPPILDYSMADPRTRVVYVPVSNTNPAETKSQNLPRQKPGRVTAQKVYIDNPSDDVTPSSDGKITIPVSGSGIVKPSKPAAPDSASPGVIKISAPVLPTKAADTSAISSAQPYLQLGNQLKMQEKYPQAIEAYKKALSVSGDDSADVNQKIAFCYQQSGKKQSARTFYQSAIDSYHQLEKEGRLSDAGRSGLKASETGIKLCE